MNNDKQFYVEVPKIDLKNLEKYENSHNISYNDNYNNVKFDIDKIFSSESEDLESLAKYLSSSDSDIESNHNKHINSSNNSLLNNS